MDEQYYYYVGRSDGIYVSRVQRVMLQDNGKAQTDEEKLDKRRDEEFLCCVKSLPLLLTVETVPFKL